MRPRGRPKLFCASMTTTLVACSWWHVGDAPPRLLLVVPDHAEEEPAARSDVVSSVAVAVPEMPRQRAAERRCRDRHSCFGRPDDREESADSTEDLGTRTARPCGACASPCTSDSSGGTHSSGLCELDHSHLRPGRGGGTCDRSELIDIVVRTCDRSCVRAGRSCRRRSRLVVLSYENDGQRQERDQHRPQGREPSRPIGLHLHLILLLRRD